MSYLAFRISPEDNPILTYGEYIVLSRGGGRGQKAENRGRGGISNIQHRISNVQVRRLIELNSYADMGVFEHILALNSNHFTALNPGKLPLLLFQGNRARKANAKRQRPRYTLQPKNWTVTLLSDKLYKMTENIITHTSGA